jgi:hypothetical protein
MSQAKSVRAVIVCLLTPLASVGQELSEPYFETTPQARAFAGETWEASQTAQLQLPSKSGIGYLQLPDGRVLHVVEQDNLEACSDVPSTSAAEASSTASGGASSGSGGGDNGTNPAQNITTFIASNEFYELDGGNQIKLPVRQ